MRSWIFAVGPGTPVLDRLSVESSDVFTWPLPVSVPQIPVGDRVFFWQEAGESTDFTGIVAEARIVNPALQSALAEPNEPIPHLQQQAEQSQVRLRLLRKATAREALKRSWLEEDPVLHDLPLFDGATEPVFPLEERHARRLEQMWARVGVDWSRSESIAGLWAYAATYGKPISTLPGSPVWNISRITGRALSGAYNKVMNFRSIDPRDSRKGMKGASEGDREVWEEFFDEATQHLDTDKLTAEFTGFWGAPPSTGPTAANEQRMDSTSNPVWFVGASFGATDDQTQRFLSEGIWENGYEDKYLDLVRSMRPGERIAIKSAYTRKHGLPFDCNGQTVSIMSIKAIGIIRENPNDGRRIMVDWETAEPPREWYFYTSRVTVWRVMPGDWMSDALIAFAFEGKPQDIERFRNEPYWRERYGAKSANEQRFPWTDFYEAVAEKLLTFADNRAALVQGIHQIAARVQAVNHLRDNFADGTSGPLKDICPFTVMGIFNRAVSVANRKVIANELARFLGVTVPVPASFDGVPLLNNLKSWFFGFDKERGAGDIDALWRVFAAASRLMEDSELQDDRDTFIQAYDAATQVRGVAWNLSTGLYWAHPWNFLTLDSQSRQYINKRLAIAVAVNGQGPCDGQTYLQLIDELKSRFREDNYPVHSFPDLSLAAWKNAEPQAESIADTDAADATPEPIVEQAPPEAFQPAPPLVPYSVEDIVKDGCFLDRHEIDQLLDRLRSKKNLILQGPPGTGKTWLAKRLAFALMGRKDESKIRPVQFHPNLSYEDFVRGWRPTGDGKLTLADGVFMETIKAAVKDSSSKFVVVIEEINRGNPAQIFGELLTLLEDSKRTPSEALELCYADPDGTRRPVHIPDNLFVIGTMNVADRSLALVDMALRRRFAFTNLEPTFGTPWRTWVIQNRNVDPVLADDIKRRMSDLNERITKDTRLGKHFCVGHSYVTPVHRLEDGGTRQWFEQIVKTEIGPLLEEYWFDATDEAKKHIARLTQDW